MSYNDYLKSPHWKNKKKDLALKRAKKCIICCQVNNLDVHHKTYKRIGSEDINKDLIYLCRRCHKAVHQFVKDNKLSIWQATERFIKLKKIKRPWEGLSVGQIKKRGIVIPMYLYGI